MSINAQIEAMACAFPEALVEGFEDLIGAIELPDEDDRHVVAAAIVADAEHIVTENLKDFPAELSPFENCLDGDCSRMELRRT